MKAADIRGRSPEDVRTLIKDMQRRLFDLSIYGHSDESPDIKETKKLRRDIARCKTVLREMELAGQPHSDAPASEPQPADAPAS